MDDPARALLMGKSMAAGYYEYSPALFDPPKLAWTGPHPETLKRERGVWPDFHHATDLEASGRVVDFLPESAADAFSLRGGPDEIARQRDRFADTVAYGQVFLRAGYRPADFIQGVSE